MRILVTGGCGFIGTNFVRHMLAKHSECRIVNIDKLTYAGNPANLQDLEDRYRFVQGDICNAPLADSLVRGADVIVHFAAESHVDRSIESSADFVRTNVVGTQVLLDAALRHGVRFHHISTDEVYGQLAENDGPFTEESPYLPRSPYAASKAAADHLVRAYWHTHELPVTISNCSNNYGPYQYPEKVIPLFITNLLRGRKVPLYGEGLQRRDWLHVQDHVEAIERILENGKPGETYLVGGGTELSNLELTKIILEEMGFTEEMIEYVEDRKGHDFRYAIDASKVREELGWRPRMDFRTGLKETIKWYEENEEWWKPLK